MTFLLSDAARGNSLRERERIRLPGRGVQFPDLVTANDPAGEA